MNKIKAQIMGASVSSNSKEAFSLHKRSHFGEPSGEKVQYSLPEALFLLEKGQIEVFHRDKAQSFREVMKKAHNKDRRIEIKYPVFKDLRNRGYVVKTALKFGADFRVYEKGSKPGDKHAKWVIFVDHESRKLTWHEFAAKNRVAHSTRKNLLIAIVDEENAISYYEVRWLKP